MVDRKSAGAADFPGSRIWTEETAGPSLKVTAGRGNWEAQRNWLNRAPPSNTRHAVITSTLYNWASYKNWADRVRGSWDKDK